MHQFSCYNPVRLHFGAGCINDLGTAAAAHGSHALLVTGRSAARASELLDRARSLLAAQGLRVSVFDRVEPNPTDATVDEGGRLARDQGCDLVVAVGGGSAMDAGKGIAVAATHDGPIAAYLSPTDRLYPTPCTLPVIAATTTSGTSSELTPFAVITVVAVKQKSAIRSDHIFPRVALVDPELTLTCPPEVTASTGVDVLCHAIEGFISESATPFTDHLAERAIALVAQALPAAVRDGGNLKLREELALANVFAGYVLSNTGVTVIHAAEHPISAHYPHVAHGRGLAALLVEYARRLWDRAPEKFARLAQLLGADVAGKSMPEAARHAADALRFLLEAVGLDLRVRDLGVERQMLARIADDTFDYMANAVGKTPGGLTRDELLELLEASFAEQ